MLDPNPDLPTYLPPYLPHETNLTHQSPYSTVLYGTVHLDDNSPPNRMALIGARNLPLRSQQHPSSRSPIIIIILVVAQLTWSTRTVTGTQHNFARAAVDYPEK